jgi:predicted amidohydrolase
MLRSFRLALGQFEPVVADKQANLAVIRALAARASEAGANAICFQEQAVCGYRFRDPKREKVESYQGDGGRISPSWGVVADWIYEMAEPVPDGPTTQELIGIARKHKMVVMAGVHELADDSNVRNAYVIVGPDGFIGRYHKVHLVPGEEHSYFEAGQGFPVFDIGPCRVGVLICYDNHFPEAHRILAMKGAHLIVMPHVTTGRSLWKEKAIAGARQQARHWILTWLRARAFDNALYCAFVNQGSDNGEGALGCSMVINPDGHVIGETDKTGRDVVLAEIDADMFYNVRRRTHHYLRYRRPELYSPLTDPQFGAQWEA